MLTTREVIKTFYNALIHKLKKHRGNWDQNDPTAEDYIKNRPFYTDKNEKVVIVPEQQIVTEGYSECLLKLPELIQFVSGQTYEVKWNNDTYNCVAFDVEGIAAIGNTVFFNGNDSGEPFIIMISKEEGVGMAFVPTAGIYNVEVTTTKIVKIDKKYLPDLGLAPVAYSNNYWDLDDIPNIPEIYTDVVRYGATQSLSDTQKTQARNNIGAGTSSFNGDYVSLTNKPYLLPIEADITDHTFSFEQDKITIGRNFIVVNGFKYYKISDLVIPRENYVSCSGVYCVVTTTTSRINRQNNYDSFKYGTNCLEPIGGIIIVESVENGKCKLPITSTFIEEFIAPSTGIYAMYDIGSNGNKHYCESFELHYQTKKPYLNAVPVNSGNGLFDIMVNEKGEICTKGETGNIICYSINEPKADISLIDEVNGYKYIVCMRDGNLVSRCAVKSIEITVMPLRTEYLEGESFDPEGMVVTATIEDGTSREINNYTYLNTMTADMTYVIISYVEGGITYTAEVPIVVKTAADVLVDFNYTDNGDGTYTLTDWKQTYNGESSSELIIPNYSNIIV